MNICLCASILYVHYCAPIIYFARWGIKNKSAFMAKIDMSKDFDYTI